MDAKTQKTLRRLRREQELLARAIVGNRRAKSFGGRPDARAERRRANRELRSYY